jgi:hypothetical protein
MREITIQLANMVSEKATKDGVGADVAAVQKSAYTFGQRTNLSARLGQHAQQFQRRSIYGLEVENAYDYIICSEVIEYVEAPVERYVNSRL